MKKFILLFVVVVVAVSVLLTAQNASAGRGAIYSISWHPVTDGSRDGTYYGGGYFEPWGNYNDGDLLGVQIWNFLASSPDSIQVINKNDQIMPGCTRYIYYNGYIGMWNVPLCVISCWPSGVYKILYEGKSDTFKVK